MTLRNRVTPLGELVADPGRGLVYGNRGCLHDSQGRLRRRWQGTRWIACRLDFRGRRRRPLQQPGRYTELFFLDEATALAAGHRPCAECRRADFERFRAFWSDLHPGEERVPAIDARLHAERTSRRAEVAVAELPDGAFVLSDADPWLVLGQELLRWTPGGYTERRRRDGRAELVTPPTLAELLRRGWVSALPLVHPSAHRA